MSKTFGVHTTFILQSIEFDDNDDDDNKNGVYARSKSNFQTLFTRHTLINSNN